LRRISAFLFSEDYGKLAENLVFQELLRKGYEIYYWKNKNEVDFIAKKDSELLGINVTFGLELPDRELQALYNLKAEFPEAKLFLITKDIEDKKEGIELIPLWKWLLM
jgi:predicted AAA+ superfamily ATPase